MLPQRGGCAESTNGGLRHEEYLRLNRDITTSKRDEHALQELNLQLDTRVRLRTAELSAAREAAVQANHSTSTFLATMSYDSARQ